MLPNSDAIVTAEICATLRKACRPRMTSCIGCGASFSNFENGFLHPLHPCAHVLDFVHTIQTRDFLRRLRIADLRQPPSCNALSTPSVPEVDVDPCAAETWLNDAAHATDPAWLPPVAGQGRATPLNLHPEPTRPSDLRSDDCAPASTRPAGPSSPDLPASSVPASVLSPRSRHPTGSAASTVRILLDPLRSRHAADQAYQAS